MVTDDKKEGVGDNVYHGHNKRKDRVREEWG